MTSAEFFNPNFNMFSFNDSNFLASPTVWSAVFKSMSTASLDSRIPVDQCHGILRLMVFGHIG